MLLANSFTFKLKIRKRKPHKKVSKEGKSSCEKLTKDELIKLPAGKKEPAAEPVKVVPRESGKKAELRVCTAI